MSDITLEELEKALAGIERATAPTPNPPGNTLMIAPALPVEQPVPQEVVAQASTVIATIAANASPTVIQPGPVVTGTAVVNPENAGTPLILESEPEPPVAKPSTGALEIREFVDVAQLKADVSIDLTDLDNTMRRHAGLFVHYANQARLARQQFELMKRNVEVMEAKLYSIHRERLTEGGKKPTEAQIDAAMKMDPLWMAAQRKEIEARAMYDLAESAKDAFSHNRDMLIQISTDRRKEREGELRVMAAVNAVDAARDTVLKGIAAAQQSVPAGGR